MILISSHHGPQTNRKNKTEWNLKRKLNSHSFFSPDVEYYQIGHFFEWNKNQEIMVISVWKNWNALVDGICHLKCVLAFVNILKGHVRRVREREPKIPRETERQMVTGNATKRLNETLTIPYRPPNSRKMLPLPCESSLCNTTTTPNTENDCWGTFSHVDISHFPHYEC